jgi:adenylylsulfate reductase subunit A
LLPGTGWAAPHKFSSGSFTEGRLAAKAAVQYVHDHPAMPTLHPDTIQQFQATIWAPLETFETYKGARRLTRSILTTSHPNKVSCACRKSWMSTPRDVGMVHHEWPNVQRGLELIQMLRADLHHLGARDLHEPLRCWELWHRTWVGEAHMRTCSIAGKPAGPYTTALIIPT